MKYFLDTEFIEDFHKPLFGNERHFIDLISIGIVAEDGREYYAISNEFDLKVAWNSFQLEQVYGDGRNIFPEGKKVYWLRENVLKPIMYEMWHEHRNLQNLHGISNDLTLYNLKRWVKLYGKSNKQIAEEIVKFVSNEPVEIIGSRGTKFLSDNAKKIIKQGYTEPEFYGYYCVAPSTKILTDKLEWVSADSIKIGDILVGFDEENPKGSGRSSKWKRYKTATCIGNKKVVMPCYKLYFNDGTTITCSENHKWLTYNQKATKWLTTKQLASSEKHKSNVVKFFDTWGSQEDYDAGYLAASFDGEGHLTQSDITHKKAGIARVILGYAQKDNEMYHKVLNSLNKKGFSPSFKKTGGKNVFAISLCKREEIIRFLGSIRPKRLLPKFDPNSFGAISPFKTVSLIKKEFIGEGEVVALSTDIKTYIAEGLASHNCDYDWVLFCSLFGRMVELPKGFPMYMRDLKQMLDERAELAYRIDRDNNSILHPSDKKIMYDNISGYLNHIKGMPNYPKQTNEHSAIHDAKWNFELYKFLKNL